MWDRCCPAGRVPHRVECEPWELSPSVDWADDHVIDNQTRSICDLANGKNITVATLLLSLSAGRSRFVINTLVLEFGLYPAVFLWTIRRRNSMSTGSVQVTRATP